MRTATATLLGALALATACFAQQPAPAGAQPPEIFDHLRQATVSIGQVRDINGRPTYIALGSGVFVAAPSGHHACLLTAKHMFFNPGDGWTPTQVHIRVAPPPGVRIEADNGTPLQVVKDGHDLWFSPDGGDLAAIPVPPLNKSWTIHALSEKDFGGADDVYQGANILVLGYPNLISQDYLISPLARGGIVSWDDPVSPTSSPFLVDANLYPGNSGGPVFHVKTGLGRNGTFMISGGGAALIGIVSLGAVQNAQVFAGGVPITATNQQTGKVDTAQARVLGIGGIGVIEPISRALPALEKCFKAAGG